VVGIEEVEGLLVDRNVFVVEKAAIESTRLLNDFDLKEVDKSFCSDHRNSYVQLSSLTSDIFHPVDRYFCVFKSFLVQRILRFL
jgi:hypothetical protein